MAVSANYDERTPCDHDPDVPRLIGWDGAGLAERPIRKARLWAMQGGRSQAQAARFGREPEAPTPREVAAAAVREYRAAWARITAKGGGA